MNCVNCGSPLSGGFYCVQCGYPVPGKDRTLTGLFIGPSRGPVRVPWGTGQVGISIVIVAVSTLLVVELIVLLGAQNNRALLTVLTSLVLGLIILGAVYLAGLLPYRAGIGSLGLSLPKTSSARTLVLTVGVLAASLGFTTIYSILVRTACIEVLEPPVIPQGIIFSGGGAVFTFLALAAWTPITEEVFFRGFIFAGLTPRWGAIRAMVASALIFSLFHDPLILLIFLNLNLYLEQGNTGVLIPIFVTALLLAWLYRRTGSVWPSVAAHAGQNAIALLVTMLGLSTNVPC